MLGFFQWLKHVTKKVKLPPQKPLMELGFDDVVVVLVRTRLQVYLWTTPGKGEWTCIIGLDQLGFYFWGWMGGGLTSLGPQGLKAGLWTKHYFYSSNERNDSRVDRDLHLSQRMTWKKIRNIWPASSQLITCFQLARQAGPGLSQLWRFAWLCALRAYYRPVKQFCSLWEWDGVDFKDLIWTSRRRHHVSLKTSPPLPLAPNFKKGSCSKSVPLNESLPCNLSL